MHDMGVVLHRQRLRTCQDFIAMVSVLNHTLPFISNIHFESHTAIHFEHPNTGNNVGIHNAVATGLTRIQNL